MRNSRCLENSVATYGIVEGEVASIHTWKSGVAYEIVKLIFKQCGPGSSSLIFILKDWNQRTVPGRSAKIWTFSGFRWRLSVQAAIRRFQLMLLALLRLEFGLASQYSMNASAPSRFNTRLKL